MNLQKKLIQLSEYKCSFKYVDSYFLVSVVYPETWSIIPSEDKSIEVAEENGFTYYAAPIETNIEVAFTLIDDTIAYNLDVEKKIALLKYNIGKLQELFAEKDLDELETIEFTFKPTKEKTSPQKKPNKKTTRKPYTKRKKEEVEGEKNEEYPSDDSFGENNDNETSFFDEMCEVNNTNVSTENKYVEEIER